VTISIIGEFERHEEAILRRLRKLEEVNIKYIKDYLLIKRQMEVD
jgi:hypothetical protein